MGDLPRHDRARDDAAGARREREYALHCGQLLRGPAVMGFEMDQLAVKPENTAAGSAAQDRRAAGDRIEGRLHVAWRTGNDAQDLRRGRLFFERLARLVDEPRILDGDDRLVGKSLDQ